MTWPFENDTGAIEKKIASKSFRSNKARNVFVIVAIILTSILYSGLFTLGVGIAESAQRADMILSGGDGHAVFYISQTEYDTIRMHPFIKEMAYGRKLADSIDNPELSKWTTYFWFYDDTALRYKYMEPIGGHKPSAENEIIADTKTLELLGVPQKVGAELTLDLTIHGQKVTRNFVLAGWWKNYPGIQYGTIVGSQAYVDAHISELPDTIQSDHIDTGRITALAKFKNTRKLNKDLQTVITESGYSTDLNSDCYIKAGLNPYYDTSHRAGIDASMVFTSLLFLITGYLIINNVFQISVLRDLHFYGLLKTLGTTERQINSIIRRQAWKLSFIGIPIGLCVGFFIGKVFLPLLAEQTSFSGNYATVSPNPLIFIAAALFALITVQISIRKPVKTASKVSPVEALRYTDSDVIKRKKEKKIRSGHPQSRMAWSNLGRNRKRTALVVLSLSLSIILTNTVFHFSHCVDPENAIKNKITFDYCIGQSSLLDYYQISEENALSQSFIRAVEQQDIFDYGGFEYGCKASYQSETTMQTYNQLEDGSYFTHLYGLDALLLSQAQVVDGEMDVKKLASGNYILEGVYTNTRGDLDESSLNHSIGDRVEVSCNGVTREFTVLAHVVANEANTYDWVGSCFFLPSKIYEEFTGNSHIMSYNFNVVNGAESEMDAFLDEYTNNVEPSMTYKSKSTLMGGVVDIQNMVVSIGGTMSFIIGLIGILNFSNTILTSIFTRRREVALLQSIGMTDKQLRKMLRQEGCTYVLLSAAVSIPLCLFFSIMIVRPVCKQIWFLNFRLNFWPIIIILPVLFLIGILIPYVAYRIISQQSVIEQLKVGE